MMLRVARYGFKRSLAERSLLLKPAKAALTFVPGAEQSMNA